MSNETEAGTQRYNISSDSIEFGLRQETKMDSQENDFSSREITLRSVDDRIKQATDPFLRRVEELCALMKNWTELESSGNRRGTGCKRDITSTSPSSIQHDSNELLAQTQIAYI